MKRNEQEKNKDRKRKKIHIIFLKKGLGNSMIQMSRITWGIRSWLVALIANSHDGFVKVTNTFA